MSTVDTQYIEKKVHLLGCWKANTVDKQTIHEINDQVKSQKGSKVKLQLSHDGIRIVKSSMIQGKMLHDYISMDRIQFMTVSRNLPDLLMVTSVVRDGNPKYQIHAFRCSNGLDAGMYINAFRSLQRYVRPVRVVKTTLNQKNGTKDEEINWTLRSKEHDNSKRELKQMVDLYGEKAVIHKVGEGGTFDFEEKEEAPVMMNGHTEVFENGVRIPLYRKGRASRMDRESFESEVSDSRSEVSESALRSELETLSQELRDIKLMLEKSTGITSGGSEPGTPRDFEQTNVKVSHHTVKPETVVINASESNANDGIDAAVYDDHAVQMRTQENGYHTTTNGSVTHVRVKVPDYRNFSEGSLAYTVTTTSAPERKEYEVVSPRASTTSYESWKKNTIERNAIRYSDLPERIQWKSRSSRPTHVVSSRSRSALPTWSTDATDSSHAVEVRHHPAGYGPSYHRVSFNPRVMKVADRKAQSLRGLKGSSSTVIKPIDQVYLGRPEAKHHSLSRRPVSANLRPSILIRDEGVYNDNAPAPTIVVEQNNNHFKADNDDHLLDVSGLDLYKETPSEGVIIRT